MAAQPPRAGPPEEFALFAPSQPSPGQQAPSSYNQQQPPDTLFSGPGRRHVTHSPDRQTDRQSGSDLQREIASPRDQHIYVPVRWISPRYQYLVRVSGGLQSSTASPVRAQRAPAGAQRRRHSNRRIESSDYLKRCELPPAELELPPQRLLVSERVPSDSAE